MVKRIWLISTSLLVIVICAGILIAVWLFPLLASIDNYNTHAAMDALNRTQLTKVQSVETFTGGQLERIVNGVNPIGQKMIVIVTNHHVYSLDANQIISSTQAKSILNKKGYPITRLIQEIPGVINLKGSLQNLDSQSLVQVWEITALLSDGQYIFAYIDMHSGRLIYEFTSQKNVPLSPQVSGLF